MYMQLGRTRACTCRARKRQYLDPAGDRAVRRGSGLSSLAARPGTGGAEYPPVAPRLIVSVSISIPSWLGGQRTAQRNQRSMDGHTHTHTYTRQPGRPELELELAQAGLLPFMPPAPVVMASRT